MPLTLQVLDKSIGQPDALFANAKRRLQEIEAAAPTQEEGAAANPLEGLADELLALRAKGMSLEQLADILRTCDIDASVDRLDATLRQAAVVRLRACESFVATQLRRGHVGSNERALYIERELVRVVKTGTGLQLHYQPQVDMRTGEVVGAEALLRWRHGTDLISPAEFIPIAEATGLIVEIGAWVMREACMEAARWKALGLGAGKGIPVSVNLSVKQFSDTLPGLIHDALCDAGLSTDLLGLEITETFLAGDVSLALLQSLHASGLQLSIDDFGTGYSCLSRVNTLPLDTIKIDRSFVTDLGRSSGARSVVETIIALAEKLGMATIAEGVETPLQADELVALGCTIAQGYLFAKPLAATEFVQFATIAEAARK